MWSIQISKLWESREGRIYFKWGHQERLQGGGGNWVVCTQWVEAGHVKVGRRALRAEGIKEEEAWRQKSTRVPNGQPVFRLFGKWGIGVGVMWKKAERQFYGSLLSLILDFSLCKRSHYVYVSRAVTRTLMPLWGITWEATWPIWLRGVVKQAPGEKRLGD